MEATIQVAGSAGLQNATGFLYWDGLAIWNDYFTIVVF